MFRTKVAPAVYTADNGDNGDDGAGTFEALVSVFNNVDAVDDRVLPGAFAKSLERWQSAGDPIPIVYSHAHRDPNALLGGVIDAKETDAGLWVRGQLDLEVPTAAAVHRHMKARRLRKFSFAYDVLDSRPAKDDSGVTELVELDVIEVGPTIIPANPATDLLGVKHGDDVMTQLAEALRAKQGRVLSARNEQRLRDAATAITEVLEQLGDVPATPDDEPATPDESSAGSLTVKIAGGLVKGPIGSHSTSTVDQAWDAAPNVSRATSEETLRAIHAWFDDDGDPAVRASYRFPHHAVDARARPGAANVRACIAGIAILNGGRGGTNIPADDRAGVWRHLARHIRDGGMEPSPLSSSTDPLLLRAQVTGFLLDPHKED